MCSSSRFTDSNYEHAAPQILIGLSDLHLFAPIETRMGTPGEPIAVKTKLGWMVYGPIPSDIKGKTFIGHHTCQGFSNQDLHDLLRNQFILEEPSSYANILPESADDRRARDILEKTTRRVSGRFETGLLWKVNEPCFPESYNMALNRLKCLERSLSKDEKLYEKVRNLIADYLTKGYAHKATARELEDTCPEHVWYLPLNVVVNPKNGEDPTRMGCSSRC